MLCITVSIGTRVNAGYKTDQRRNKDSQQQGDDICPGRQRDVLRRNDDKAENKAQNQHGNVPPPRCLLVALGHVRMVAIIVSTLLGVFVCLDDIASPEEEAMSDEGANLKGCQYTGVAIRGQYGVMGLTAALAINMAYAKLPVSRGIPYFSSAS